MINILGVNFVLLQKNQCCVCHMVCLCNFNDKISGNEHVHQDRRIFSVPYVVDRLPIMNDHVELGCLLSLFSMIHPHIFDNKQPMLVKLLDEWHRSEQHDHHHVHVHEYRPVRIWSRPKKKLSVSIKYLKQNKKHTYLVPIIELVPKVYISTFVVESYPMVGHLH